MKPYIVKSINEPETNTVILENKPTILRKVISDETSEKVRFALESVVTNGTGRNAFIEGYRVGGKTGTAQKAVNGAYLIGNYITSFIGFLPANDPEVVVYIAIDNAKGVSQFGGTVAAPVARNLMVSIIDILNIEKPVGASSKNYNWYDKKYATVDDVIGMSLNDAIKTLKQFKVEYKGSGDKVVHQSPASGSSIYEGEVIMLYLN